MIDNTAPRHSEEIFRECISLKQKHVSKKEEDRIKHICLLKSSFSVLLVLSETWVFPERILFLMLLSPQILKLV